MLELEGAPFKTYWTEDLLAEVIYHLRRNHPEWDGGKISNIRDRITETVEGGRIADFVVDGTSPWKDPHDSHVHAAALAGAVGYIVTADQGFQDPDVNLDALPYEIYRPDEFLELVNTSSPTAVRRVIEKQVRYFIKLHGEVDLYGPLRAAGCSRFADLVREHLQRMD